jgi:hypothetical protein|tara:strand:- start:1095 stop:1256 length:162 start_codon:yes stop_codon:yes gene_type:complete
VIDMDIEIDEESVKIEADGSKVEIKGILSKRHALILVSLILAILGIKEFDIPL